MKHTIIFIGIILSLSSFAYSNEKIVKYIKNGTTVFCYDSTAATFDETKLNKHIATINALHQSINSILKRKEENTLSSSVDTVSVVYDQNLKILQYNNINKYGIGTIIIGDDGFPRYIYFNITPDRNFTKEESEINKKTKKIPISYCTITEQQAVELARTVHNTIYGSNESSKFDSVSISGDYQSYIVVFRIKPKNDIWDSRSSHFKINANTGEIETYTGDGIRDIEFTYIPQIAKSKVLQMYSDECLRLGANIVINKVVLDKYTFNGERRWAWTIYGWRKDKKLSMAAAMFFDSETGEVLYKNME
jgi:hypothetical protein